MADPNSAYPQSSAYGQQQPPPYSQGYPPPAAYGQQPQYGQPQYGQPQYGQPQPQYGHSQAQYVQPQPYGQHPEYGSQDHTAVPVSGQMSGPDAGGDEGGFTTAFKEENTRRMFIKKVYITLSLQLLVTFGVVTLFTYVNEISNWVQYHPGAYYASYGVFLFTYIVLACGQQAARKSPINYIALSILTLSLTYMTATIASFYDTKTVFVAMGTTLAITIAITLFSMQTKIDFTKMAAFICIFSMSVFMFGFFCIFFYSEVMYAVYGWLIALLFGMYLMFDTHLIMGGKKFELSEEEYVFASLMLYIDIVYLFLIILALFGKN